MDVGVEAAGGQDLALARDHLRPRTDDDGDAGLDVRIAGLADGVDEPVLEADVGLDDPPMVEDDGVGDDGVDGAPRVGGLRLAHAVADHLAAAELHLLAVGGEILLDLDHELGVGEAQPVALGRPEHLGVMGARQRGRGEAELREGGITDLDQVIQACIGTDWKGAPDLSAARSKVAVAAQPAELLISARK